MSSARTVRYGASEFQKCAGTTGLEPDLAGEHFLPHHPVADEAVERVAEGRRPVVLEEVVPDPGEGVARDEAGEQPPEIQGGQRVQDREQAERGADEMQSPAGSVGMLGQIEGV